MLPLYDATRRFGHAYAIPSNELEGPKLFEAFSHYLSYGATDQQTARELTGEYDGLLVPGTVAAFQADGTKGFVLTLSASATSNTQYVIDSRFPLFQQSLLRPKKSHVALAELLGEPSLVSPHQPQPSDFDPDRIRSIANNWVRFNLGYTSLNSKHFDKYAKRLGAPVVPENVNRPKAVLAPYVMADGPGDPWWDISTRLWDETLDALEGEEVPGVRVVAAKSAGVLGALLSESGTDRAVIWVDGLDEFNTEPDGLRELLQYATAVKDAAGSTALFSLYGGYFAVMLGAYGLRGASHGIGYGEHRAYVELPNSGPPPARYYLPLAHKYVSQDLAEFLAHEAPQLVECRCVECAQATPGDLAYHSLMKHSVHARALEIASARGKSADELAQELEANSALFDEALSEVRFPLNLGRQSRTMYKHLEPWAYCIRNVG